MIKLPLHKPLSALSTVTVKYNGGHFSKIVSLHGVLSCQLISSFAFEDCLQFSLTISGLGVRPKHT